MRRKADFGQDVLFNKGLVKSAIATDEAMAAALKHGKRVELEGAEGRVVAYLLDGVMFVTEVTVKSEG